MLFHVQMTVHVPFDTDIGVEPSVPRSLVHYDDDCGTSLLFLLTQRRH